MNVLESFKLDNKTALVTGGAGLYGRQVAEALAQAGAKTFMASRGIEKLEQQAQTFRDDGLDVTALQFDQSREESVESLLEEIQRIAGGVDVLVNNAVLRPMKGWDHPEATQEWKRSMDVNATGLFLMCRIFGNHMAQRGGGSIVNVGSIQGTVGPDFSLYEGLGMDPPPDYYFHKGGMNQLTRYVASRFGKQNVRVNTVSPGGFFNHQDPTFVERYNERTMLGRMANESDLKGAIVFLASQASAYVTGENLLVDGGYVSK